MLTLQKFWLFLLCLDTPAIKGDFKLRRLHLASKLIIPLTPGQFTSPEMQCFMRQLSLIKKIRHLPFLSIVLLFFISTKYSLSIFTYFYIFTPFILQPSTQKTLDPPSTHSHILLISYVRRSTRAHQIPSGLHLQHYRSTVLTFLMYNYFSLHIRILLFQQPFLT